MFLLKSRWFILGLFINIGGLVMTGEALRVNSNAMNYQNNLTRAYANCVGLSEGISSLDMGLDSSCFGANNFMTGGGFGYGFGGYGPGSECQNMTQKQYMRYQENLENEQIDMQVRRDKKLKSAGFDIAANENALSRQIGFLQDNIKENEQDKVSVGYTELMKTARTKLIEDGCNNPKEEQVKSYAEELYYKATGVRLIDDIRNNGDSSFVKGMKDGAFGLGFLLNDKTSSAANISNVTGENVSKADGFGYWTGRVATGLVTVPLGLVIAPKLLGGAKCGAVKSSKAAGRSWAKLFGMGAKEANEVSKAPELLKTAEKILKSIR